MILGYTPIPERRMRMITRRGVAFAALLAAAIGTAGPALAVELRVASSGGFAAAWRALLPAYEKMSGNTVSMVWGPSMGATPQAIPQRLKNGEPLDVIILVDDAAEQLCKAGQADPATKRVLARSLIAVAVKAGAPRPDISSTEALRKALIAAKSVAYSDSASGVYLSSTLFPRLGVWDQIKDKSRMIPGVPVGEIVARGEAELGFQQFSELKPVAGIEIIGLIPEATQQVTLFSAVMVSNARQATAAQGLIQFLASPAAVDAIRQSGLEPANPGP
jgi:molybdate transport system substrate-binding protein